MAKMAKGTPKDTITRPLPLGKWKLQQPLQHGWFYHLQDKALYYHQNQEWTRHGPIPWKTLTKAFHWDGHLETNKPEMKQLQVASVMLQGQQLIFRYRPSGSSGIKPHQYMARKIVQITAGSHLAALDETHRVSWQHPSGHCHWLSTHSIWQIFPAQPWAAMWIIEGITSACCVTGLMVTQKI